MRSLNLDQLRALMEVVELGSFSAAARRLNLTQPAVSLQIRELERRFGVRLIERLGKQAHATVPGRAAGGGRAAHFPRVRCWPMPPCAAFARAGSAACASAPR